MPRMLGAIASPRHKLAAAAPHVAAAAPVQFARLAKVLRYFGNNVDGNCVPTEEYFAKDADGFLGTDQDCIGWSRKNGWLNGATLTEVMDVAIASGVPITGAPILKDGPYTSVDWTDYATLCSAIYQGQVKIGVAARVLLQHATDTNGWMVLSARHDGNIDHCICYCGYGPLSYCCQQLGVSVPSGADPNMPCIIGGTWSTYFIISHAASVNIVGEAWLRNPTTPGIVPPHVDPTDDPCPLPNPNL